MFKVTWSKETDKHSVLLQAILFIIIKSLHYPIVYCKGLALIIIIHILSFYTNVFDLKATMYNSADLE